MLLLLLLAQAPDTDLVAKLWRHAAAGESAALSVLPQLQTAETATASRILRGMTLLVLQRNREAKPLLQGATGFELYRAMAELGEPGGRGRAKGILAEAARKTPRADLLFLAALAFAEAGQAETAHQLLAQAVKKAPSVLDPAFAPDPWWGLALATEPFLVGEAPARRHRLAELLLRAGRPGLAYWAAAPGAAGAPIRSLVLQSIDPGRALDEVKLGLADPKLRTQEILLRWRSNEAEAAALVTALADQDPPSQRAKAQVALAAGKLDEALRRAEAAATEDPASAEGLAILIRVLIAQKKLDRAAAFLDVLMARRPTEVNPFELAMALEAARGGSVLEAKSRATGFEAALKQARVQQKLREDVLQAVRTAERGLGLAGVESQIRDAPGFALPLQLLVVQQGPGGSARMARDRIFLACAAQWSRLLAGPGASVQDCERKDWASVCVESSLYGKMQWLQLPLSAADPGRCGGGATQRVRIR